MDNLSVDSRYWGSGTGRWRVIGWQWPSVSGTVWGADQPREKPSDLCLDFHKKALKLIMNSWQTHIVWSHLSYPGWQTGTHSDGRDADKQKLKGNMQQWQGRANFRTKLSQQGEKCRGPMRFFLKTCWARNSLVILIWTVIFTLRATKLQFKLQLTPASTSTETPLSIWRMSVSPF